MNSRVIKYNKRRIRRKFNNEGIQIHNGMDMCDCLNIKCGGCFFPCPKCKSNKCGPTCRVNRRFKYNSCEDEMDRCCKYSQE